MDKTSSSSKKTLRVEEESAQSGGPQPADLLTPSPSLCVQSDRLSESLAVVREKMAEAAERERGYSWPSISENEGGALDQISAVTATVYLSKHKSSLASWVAGEKEVMDDEDFYGFLHSPRGKLYFDIGNAYIIGGLRGGNERKNLGPEMRVRGTFNIVPLTHGGAFKIHLLDERPGAAVEELTAWVTQDSIMSFKVAEEEPDAWPPGVGNEVNQLKEGEVVWRIYFKLKLADQQLVTNASGEEHWTEKIWETLSHNLGFLILVQGTNESGHEIQAMTTKMRRKNRSPLQILHVPELRGIHAKYPTDWQCFEQMSKGAALIEAEESTIKKAVSFRTWDTYSTILGTATCREGIVSEENSKFDHSARVEIAALDKLSSQPTMKSHLEIRQALLCSGLEQVPTKDLLKYVRSTYPRLEQDFAENDLKAAIMKCGQAPGGLLLARSDSLDLRTKFVSTIAKLHASTRVQQQVLVISSSEERTNELATRLQHDLHSIKEITGECEDRYMIKLTPRFQANAIEELVSAARTMKPQLGENLNTPISSSTTQTLLSELDTSLGYHMLSMAGFGIPGGGPNTASSDTIPQSFRTLHLNINMDMDIDKITTLPEPEFQEYNLAAHKLMMYTLKHAAIVITPVLVSSNTTLLTAIRSTVALVMVDDIGQVRESRLWPSFAADFLKMPGFLAVGGGMDEVVKEELVSDRMSNPFVVQIEGAFLRRMVEGGFEGVVEL